MPRIVYKRLEQLSHISLAVSCLKVFQVLFDQCMDSLSITADLIIADSAACFTILWMYSTAIHVNGLAENTTHRAR